MTKLFRFVARWIEAMALAGFTATAAVAQAIETQHVSKATSSGHRIEISRALQANRDCSFDGYPAIKIVKAPLHGRIRIAEGRVTPSFPKNNPRRRCNGSRLEGLVVDYTPAAKFVGHDFVELAVAFQNGELIVSKIDIDVE